MSDAVGKWKIVYRLGCGQAEHVRAEAEVLEVCQARARTGVAASCTVAATPSSQNIEAPRRFFDNLVLAETPIAVFSR